MSHTISTSFILALKKIESTFGRTVKIIDWIKSEISEMILEVHHFFVYIISSGESKVAFDNKYSECVNYFLQPMLNKNL